MDKQTNETEEIMKEKFGMAAGVIYAADEPHDPDRPEFDCYCPVDYADGSQIGDCWVCDKNGNIHPGYSASPVPVNVQNLMHAVGRMKT